MSKQKLNATTLAEQLADNLSLNKRTAEDFIKAFVTAIEESLLIKDVVKLKGLGTFKLQWNAPRKSIDVNTGEEIEIDGYYKVVFVPEDELKGLVNEPYEHLEAVLLSEDGGEKIETAVNNENFAESVASLKLFNQQADEIKDIISEIKALSKPAETAPIPPIQSKNKLPLIPLPSDEFQKKISKPHPENKKKKTNKRTLDYLFIAAMIGGLFIYVLVDFNAFTFFTDFMKSNKMKPLHEFSEPLTIPMVEVDTVATDTFSIQTSDSIAANVDEITQSDEQSDELESLFKQPRIYKEFIATEEVIPGSRLTRIAERHYGAKEFWVYIYEANKDKFINPDQVAVGTILKIPKLNPMLADKDNPRCIEFALHLHDVYLNE